MAGRFGPTTPLWPEPRPEPLDGPLPDVLFDADFVVDWQVAERPVGVAGPDGYGG